MKQYKKKIYSTVVPCQSLLSVTVVPNWSIYKCLWRSKVKLWETVFQLFLILRLSYLLMIWFGFRLCQRKKISVIHWFEEKTKCCKNFKRFYCAVPVLLLQIQKNKEVQTIYFLEIQLQMSSLNLITKSELIRTIKKSKNSKRLFVVLWKSLPFDWIWKQCLEIHSFSCWKFSIKCEN